MGELNSFFHLIFGLDSYICGNGTSLSRLAEFSQQFLQLADGPQSVIRMQVTNGVAVRMAVLATIAATRRAGAA